jgi:hypothetical protein
MEGREQPHADKDKEITNDWNFDASCTLTSLPVWNLENFKRLISVAQNNLVPLPWPPFCTLCKNQALEIIEFPDRK